MNHDIPSFVRRNGRMSCAQKRHLKESLPKLILTFNDEEVADLNLAFGREAPKIMEIGFGMGDSSAQMAQDQPQNDFWCVDVHLPGVGALAKLVTENQLSNVKISIGDAVHILKYHVAEKTLDGVYILFPDPWPKKRHHKRRLIQPHFIALLTSRLKTGAFIHLATDWEDYAQSMLAVLSENQALKNDYEGFAVRGNRPLTKFEKRGMRFNHPIWDLVFQKIE